MGNCPTLIEKCKDKVPCLLPIVQHWGGIPRATAPLTCSSSMHLKTGIYYLVCQIAADQLLVVQLQSTCVYGYAMVHDMIGAHTLSYIMASYPETGAPGW